MNTLLLFSRRSSSIHQGQNHVLGNEAMDNPASIYATNHTKPPRTRPDKMHRQKILPKRTGKEPLKKLIGMAMAMQSSIKML
jgi:hypothetical protein